MPTPHPDRRILAGTLAIFVGLLGGCATPARDAKSHLIRVNSTASEPVQKGAAFHLVAARGSVDDSTLVYGEVTRLVKGALAAKGLHEAPGLDQAAVVVEIDYGMSAARPRERAGFDPALPQSGALPRIDDEDQSLLRNSGRGPLDKHLVLTAREANAKGDGPPRTLWRVEMSAVDLSNDLRKYLPLLATVGIDQIGQDSGGSLLIRINENDKTVSLLKQKEP